MRPGARRIDINREGEKTRLLEFWLRGRHFVWSVMMLSREISVDELELRIAQEAEEVLIAIR